MTKEPTEYAPGSDAELEARLDAVEALQLEARRDRVKDVEREAKIEKLESAGGLVEEDPAAALVQGGWDTRDNPKIRPAKLEKAWYAKSAAAQRSEIEKISGTYRSGSSPTQVRTPKGFLLSHPWTLKDKNDGPGDAIIKAGEKPKPGPPPAPAPEPIAGYCRECHKALPRFGLKAGAKFCSKAHANAYRYREMQRDKADQAFKNYRQSKFAARTLEIHRLVADALQDSADRLGIDAAFTATHDGVEAVHSQPLPAVRSLAFLVWLEVGDGRTLGSGTVVATATSMGTLYTFETSVPSEGSVRSVFIEFEGDPGIPTARPVQPFPPLLSVRQALLTNRVAEYMTMRKRALVAA